MTVKLDRVIIGSNPFIGVSYLSQEKRFEYSERFNKAESIAKVVEKAVEYDFPMISSENNVNVANALEIVRKKGTEFKVLPVVPSAYQYVKKASEVGVSGILEGLPVYTKFKLALKAPRAIKSSITGDVMGLFSTLLDIELARFEKFDMPVIFLHGVTADLAVSVGNMDMLKLFCNMIRERYDAEPAFATHNLGKLLPAVEREKVPVNIIMAPVNKKGFMMNPSQEKSLELIRKTKKQIIAKKVLAGGRISPEEGLEDVYKDVGLDSAMIGIGSVNEAVETLELAKKYV